MYKKFIELILLPIGDFLLRTNLMGELKKWRKISQLSGKEIEQISIENLRNILTDCVHNVPYYKEFSNQENLNPVEWLKKFPIMTKEEINKETHRLTSKPLDQLIKKESSGSSGIHTTTYQDQDSWDKCRAIQMFWWEWAGWEIGQPILQTGMTLQRSRIKQLKDFFLRTNYISAFGLNTSDLIVVLKKYIRRKNHFLAGYASSLYCLAKTANLSSNIDIRFKSAVSWGDKLFPHYKKEIETAFKCKIIDTYALSEGLMIAAQKDSIYYYIMSPHIFLELLDDNENEVPNGEIGKVVVTRLDAIGMPFIRYYTGDLAIKLPQSNYPENLEFNFPLLEIIIGRDTDIVKLENGDRMIVHFFTAIFEKESSFKQFKIVQKNLQGIEIQYIKSEKFNISAKKRIHDKIIKELSGPIKITWIEVDDIANTSSGKPQIIEILMKN